MKQKDQLYNMSFDVASLERLVAGRHEAYAGTVTGRFSSSQPNQSTLPKHDQAMHRPSRHQMIFASYPGKDGIGVDIETNPCLDLDVYAKVANEIFAGQSIAADILTQQDVVYANTHKAKVVSFDPARDMAVIKFNDKGLIPPEMEVPVRTLSYAYGGQVVNPQTHCPQCQLAWKEVVLARFSVYDCPGCGAKKEDHAP